MIPTHTNTVARRVTGFFSSDIRPDLLPLPSRVLFGLGLGIRWGCVFAVLQCLYLLYTHHLPSDATHPSWNLLGQDFVFLPLLVGAASVFLPMLRTIGNTVALGLIPGVILGVVMVRREEATTGAPSFTMFFGLLALVSFVTTLFFLALREVAMVRWTPPKK